MEVGYITLSVKSSVFNKEYADCKAKLVLLNIAGFVTRITGEQFIKENQDQFPNVSMNWDKLSTF